MPRVRDVLGGLNGRANGCGVERLDCAQAGIEKKLRGLRVWGFVGSLLRRRRRGRVDIAYENAITKVSVGDLAKFRGLSVSFGRGADDVEAGNTAVEPEAGDVGEVGAGNLGIEVKQDTDVMTTGLVDEVVKVVEGAIGRVDGLSVGSIRLDGGEEEGVDTERLNVVEALSDSVETAAFGGTEVDGIHLIDDGVLPPNVGVDAGSDPARSSESLSRNGRGNGASEAECKESARDRHSQCAC